jgi:hypothetical protein
MSRPTAPPDNMTDDGYHIVQNTVPVKGFYSPSKFWEDLQVPPLIEKQTVPTPVPPTPEEIESNSWTYCFTNDGKPLGPIQSRITFPVPLEESDESHQ